MAGGNKGLLNQIGFGGWQLASMIARPAGIWPYESLLWMEFGDFGLIPSQLWESKNPRKFGLAS